jgi:Nif-specific regulatory protein
MEPAEAHAGEVRKLSTLLEASQALSATLDLHEALQRVLEILGRHHGAVRSTVVLLSEESGEVELEASAGAVPRGRRVRYRLGEGVVGKVVESGKPIVVPRVSREHVYSVFRDAVAGSCCINIVMPVGRDKKKMCRRYLF